MSTWPSIRPAIRPSITRSIMMVAPLAAIVMWVGCGAGTGEPNTRESEPSAAPGVAADRSSEEPEADENAWFVDHSAAVGLDFQHFNGAAGDFYYPEILPPGVGLFDYDNDGDLDAVVVQGRMLRDDQTLADALVPPPPSASPAGTRLFRNDLPADEGEGGSTLRFVDVTEESGITADGYGLGVATGDIDNDGWVDLLVTNFGPTQLFRNDGDGTFTDVSAAAGIQERREFGVSASFVDYDRDGWLDLYVGNNVDYDLDNATVCPNQAGARDYCPPKAYGGLPDRLYRNRGDGTFDDVSETALRHVDNLDLSQDSGARFGPALGVSAADYDGDDWSDIYVANDGSENLLWMNQRDGTFINRALVSGAALSARGSPEASMGIGSGDFDNDGDEDIFVTHLTTEGNNLYVNDGAGTFQDRSAQSALGSPSLPYTGWGTTFFDFDNDGWLELMSINGSVAAAENPVGPFPYDERKTLFRNLGNGRFEEVTDQAGAVFELSEVGRGAAFGDVDNDGDVDVLVGNNGGPLRLLINTIGNRNHWVGLRLVGVGGRDMLGARAALARSDGPTLWRRAHTDGSYASANDPRILVGLGASTENPAVRVLWPSGRSEEFAGVAIDRYTTLIEGSGEPVETIG